MLTNGDFKKFLNTLSDSDIEYLKDNNSSIEYIPEQILNKYIQRVTDKQIKKYKEKHLPDFNYDTLKYEYPTIEEIKKDIVIDSIDRDLEFYFENREKTNEV